MDGDGDNVREVRRAPGSIDGLFVRTILPRNPSSLPPREFRGALIQREAVGRRQCALRSAWRRLPAAPCAGPSLRACCGRLRLARGLALPLLRYFDRGVDGRSSRLWPRRQRRFRLGLRLRLRRLRTGHAHIPNRHSTLEHTHGPVATRDKLNATSRQVHTTGRADSPIDGSSDSSDDPAAVRDHLLHLNQTFPGQHRLPETIQRPARKPTWCVRSFPPVSPMVLKSAN